MDNHPAVIGLVVLCDFSACQGRHRDGRVKASACCVGSLSVVGWFGWTLKDDVTVFNSDSRVE